MNNIVNTTAAPLAISLHGDEPRIDSRLLAQGLCKKHRSLIAQIRKYETELRDLGKLRFQIAPLPDSATGQKERFALLSEDQTAFMLTLSRNTPRIVALKVRLVHAFGQARRAAQMRQEAYLPSYRDMQDQAAKFDCDKLFRNLNKLVNTTLGIQSGQRHNGMAYGPLEVAHRLATTAMQGARDNREAYARAKAALEPLRGLMKQPVLLEG